MSAGVGVLACAARQAAMAASVRALGCATERTRPSGLKESGPEKA